MVIFINRFFRLTGTSGSMIFVCFCYAGHGCTSFPVSGSAGTSSREKVQAEIVCRLCLLRDVAACARFERVFHPSHAPLSVPLTRAAVLAAFLLGAGKPTIMAEYLREVPPSLAYAIVKVPVRTSF